jgi:outer membrane protein assembly factor BamB
MRLILPATRTATLALALILALAARSAAQTTPLWSLTQSIAGPAVSEFDPSVAYYAVGNTLHAVWTESVSGPGGHLAGTERWTWCGEAGTTINNFPSPIPSSNDGGSLALFISGTDGIVRKIDATSGSIVWSYDTRRPTCAQDQVISTPSVQLKQYSNSTFVGAHGGNDLVYVVTRYACGGTFQNRIIAIGGIDGQAHWQFNAAGAIGVGYGSEGCAIDYQNNRLYCGTFLDTGTSLSLWSLDVITGALRWSHNAGSIQNRPTLATSNRLYVGNLSAQIHSYDVSGASPILRWIQPVIAGRNIRKNIQVVISSTAPDRIFALDDGGVLHAYEDGSSMPTPLWPSLDGGGIGYRSLSAVLPNTSKAYLARNDGRVQQLSTTLGSVEAFRDIGTTGPSAPAPFSTLGIGSPEDRVLAAALGPDGVVLQQFCAPWTPTGCGTSVSVPETQDLSGPARLLSSAPNPFRDATRLHGVLPHAARLEIAVFDLQGQFVRTFRVGNVAAGEWSLEWDGRDEGGREAPSGVYVYRLRALAPDRAPIETSRTFAKLR